MKADWESLMADYKDSSTTLVADVDCTAGGESLCQDIGVQGYPTIKHGDPNDLQDYEGGRSLDDLRSFAKNNLGPQCGPKYLDLCDDAKKAEIVKYSSMSSDELDAFIKTGKDALEKLEADFKAFVGTLDKQMEAVSPDEKDALLNRLRKEYKEKSDEKDAAVAKVKASGLGLAKAVKASLPSGNAEL
jgi:hypothetical protein